MKHDILTLTAYIGYSARLFVVKEVSATTEVNDKDSVLQRILQQICLILIHGVPLKISPSF